MGRTTSTGVNDVPRGDENAAIKLNATEMEGPSFLYSNSRLSRCGRTGSMVANGLFTLCSERQTTVGVTIQVMTCPTTEKVSVSCHLLFFVLT
jgi:hypothetical protein